MKITMLGAGSLGFTRRLLADILAVEELRESEFALFDIDEAGLERITSLCRKFVDENNLPTRVEAYLDRKKALEGADFAISTVRVGGLEAFARDVEIPLKYGVDQCVGDTLGPGGIFYALRTIPVLLDFCKDMREVCPDLLFLNYSNPMAMNSWAVLREGGVKYVGLCHGVQGSHHLLARVLGVPAEELDYVAAGINHQTWFIRLEHKGRNMLPEVFPAFKKNEEAMKNEPARVDVLERFGYWSTESNGHLSEYLPWYRKRPKEIRKWIDMSDWIHGETGGYLRVCIEGRNWFETEVPRWLAEEPPELDAIERSAEHASYIIESLETGRRYRGHFNVRNNGTIANLPADCIVEVPAYVDGNGISVPRVGELPMACAATCAASVNVQRMGMEAAVHGDVRLLKLAMLHDPLVGAVCNPPEVWQMTDELLVAQAEWLPQYADEIPEAKRRLATAKPLGARTARGAARLKVRTLAELRRDSSQVERLTAADKAAETAADKSARTPRPGRTGKSAMRRRRKEVR